ncbi:MAG: protein BatD, partial [Epsilonproteobacteria bacterium]|nr:protein BatD [Campylobacterota bacterium]
MRSIPGKIMLWLLAVAAAMAGVTASLDKSEITKGETVTLTITADGDEVIFPVIDQIGGYPVLGTARRSFISMENGVVRRSVSKSYTFAPMKDLDIPSYEVTVDGQVERTPPLKVRVKAAPATTQRASAALRIDLQKRELYVGEPV